MKFKWIRIVIGLVAVYFLGAFVLWRSQPSLADFVVRLMTTFGIFGAIIAALFGEYLREKLFPVNLCIEDTEEDRNAVFDQHKFDELKFQHLCPEIAGKIFDVYCHHLRVRNLTPHRPLKDCRVWLKKVEVQNAGGEWILANRSPVPRLMEWAPSEYSRDKRTFSTQQVFDFGQTLAHNGGFLLTIERDQGGAFNPLFKTGHIRFHFYATAENYQEEKVFCFEVEVLPSVPGMKVTPAKVTQL